MEPDPVQYPTVKIAGKVYELMFRSGDVIRLKKAGIDLGIQQTLTGIDALERTITILHHAIAHQAPDMTTEQLMDLVPWDQASEINLAISQAISKVLSQAVALKPRLDAFVAETKLLSAQATAQADPTVQ